MHGVARAFSDCSTAALQVCTVTSPFCVHPDRAGVPVVGLSDCGLPSIHSPIPLGSPHQKKIVPVLASKREHTRLSKSALATATRLTMPCHKCSPNRVQAHTLRLFSPKHSVTPLPPCQSELDSPRLPPASAARLLWTSSAAPRGREGVCPGREVARPRTANPV